MHHTGVNNKGGVDTNNGNDPDCADGKSEALCSEGKSADDGSNDDGGPNDSGVDTNDDVGGEEMVIMLVIAMIVMM